MTQRLDLKFHRLIWIVLVLVTAGCAAKAQYVEPTRVRANPQLAFNPNDLQMIAGKMAESLLATDIFDPAEKPIIRITEVKNKTSEHIDTKAITDKVRTTLIKSRKVKFVADKREAGAEQDMFKEFEQQMDPSGKGALMDDKAKLRPGKLKGPKYHLFGEIISIANVDKAGKDVYYKMTLNLMNLEQGTLDWSEEKEVRKVKDRSVFGR